jgi:hypothetical protein
MATAEAELRRQIKHGGLIPGATGCDVLMSDMSDVQRRPRRECAVARPGYQMVVALDATANTSQVIVRPHNILYGYPTRGHHEETRVHVYGAGLHVECDPCLVPQSPPRGASCRSPCRNAVPRTSSEMS